jgi:hypothetical protein
LRRKTESPWRGQFDRWRKKNQFSVCKKEKKRKKGFIFCVTWVMERGWKSVFASPSGTLGLTKKSASHREVKFSSHPAIKVREDKTWE